MTPTIEKLAQEAFEALDGAHDDDERIRLAVGEQVPATTSVLFQMVVDDNALAFLDIDGEYDSPFTALAGAIFEAIEAELRDLIGQAERDAEDEDDEP